MKKFWNGLVGFVFGVALLFGTPAVEASAAEFTVTAAEAVLYTNDNTVILSDADNNAVVVPEVAANLPILVTGVTSNGYFQISLDGQTYYIHGIGLSAAETVQAADTAVSSTAPRQAQVYDIIMAQKAVFPEGMHWTNDNYYAWKGGTFSVGFGCAGFAFALSDAAFGDVKARTHYDYSDIKVGDILRVNNGTHSVIVLEVRDNSVIVAEGNYNESIHWGREIPKSRLIDEDSYIMTRY